ncbi:MAG: hypothetical protein ACRYGB_05745 [Janthinobacterium lividum]
MRRLLLFAGALCFFYQSFSQAVNPRPITMDEYVKAKTFTVKDPDNDTYVKFENAYILDRYRPKPYFITGDDGLKKRMDLYNLVAKEGLQQLGLMIFYTNEKGKHYQALLPNQTADGKVWERYFEDIHAIDKEEKNFVLKLSYVLSREFSFQVFKNINGGKNMKDEAGTYGSDICFPGTDLVTMANGSQKMLSTVKPGDQVLSIDPKTKQSTVVNVKELSVHEAKNYALTRLVLISAEEKNTDKNSIRLAAKVLEATPNHPMTTVSGQKKIGETEIGEQVLCYNEAKKAYETYTVLQKTEKAGGVQKVYNIVAGSGSTLMMNGVMVMQK